MSKSKSPNLPDAPSFQADPNVAWSQDFLKGQSNYLINGLTQNGGNLSGLLGDTISFNPQTTQLALDAMRSQLAPSYRNSQQNLTNTLEANNQLTGSTTASSFGNLEADYMSQLTNATAQAGLADINRALQNRVSLYGTGLNTAGTVGNNALENQSQTNQFALANYENQVAQALSSQGSQKGGLVGGLMGAVGGGLQGFAMGGPAGAAVGAGLGGFAGYQGSSGTGGGIFSAGSSAYGQSKPLSLNISSIGSNQGGESINQSLLQPYRYGLGSGSSYGF